jgi:hypothetical protein
MLTNEIPSDQWVRRLDAFSKQHEGWIVQVEVVGEKLGDQFEVDGLPLVGVTADVKDGERRVEVIAGGRPDAHVTHTVDKPKRVWLTEPDEVGQEALAVEAGDGTTTIVHFRRVPPEDAVRQLPRT